MAFVRIPAVADSHGVIIPGKVTITLVDRNGVKRTAWVNNSDELIQECRDLELVADVVVQLVPQNYIAIDADGSPTYYRFLIEANGCSEYWDVQVPDEEGVLRLRDLITLEEIEPGSSLYDRLLPVDAKDGQIARWDASQQRWVADDETIAEGGDMYKAVYDPTRVESNAFQQENMAGVLDAGTFTGGLP